MSWTPGWFSCINSKSLFTTVFKNFQWALRKRGYCPTTYMISLATTALLSFPFLHSQRPRSSLMTVTRNLFSDSSAGNIRQYLFRSFFLHFIFIIVVSETEKSERYGINLIICLWFLIDPKRWINTSTCDRNQVNFHSKTFPKIPNNQINIKQIIKWIWTNKSRSQELHQ